MFDWLMQFAIKFNSVLIHTVCEKELSADIPVQGNLSVKII
jgi:uncharacterized lipoprotein YbaY